MAGIGTKIPWNWGSGTTQGSFVLAGARSEGIAGEKWDSINEEGGEGLPAPSITAWTKLLLFPNAELLKKDFQKVLARVRAAPAQGGDTGHGQGEHKAGTASGTAPNLL